MRKNFDTAFAHILRSEGGFTDDPRDPGNRLPDGRKGCTNLGVTQAAWEDFVGHQVTHDDMRALKPKDVSPFYRLRYWDAVRADELPSGVDYVAFDFAINAGPARSRKCLQQALGVTSDGVFGPMTMAAIAKADGKLFLKAFSLAKEAFYRSLPTFGTFGKGWLSRVRDVEVAASRMFDQVNLA